MFYSFKQYFIIIAGFLPISLMGQERDSTKRERSFAIYPAFGYQPETSLQLGAVAVWVSNKSQSGDSLFNRQSSINPFFLYTFKNQILSEVSIDYFFRNGINLVISPRFFNFPDFYFGIGNDNDPNDKESYTNVFGQVDGQLYFPLRQKVFVGAAFDLNATKIKGVLPEGKLFTDNVNGIDGGTLAGIGPTFKYDSRNSVIYPSQGSLISVQSIFYMAGDFTYTNYIADLRKYVKVKNEKNILAFQVLGNFTSGSDIPFYKLPQLGGPSRLRGIANASLYRDRQLLYTQVEYRRHLFWRMSMVAFVGMGDVAQGMNDFNFSEFKYVAGVGSRFAVIPNQKLHLRFDFGVSDSGQTGFYVGMREAF